MWSLTSLLLVTLLVGPCVPQNVENFILHTLESIAARQGTLLQKFDEQSNMTESKIDEMDSKIERVIEELEELKLSIGRCSSNHQINTFQDLLAIDECERNTHNCSIHATCYDLPIHFECSCMAGYSGDGVICEDVNECEDSSNVCGGELKCINFPGSYNCSCNEGFRKQGNTCQEIKDLTEIKDSNCKDLLNQGVTRSGVYTIFPEGFPGGVEVYCDQETAPGGWTMILRREKQTNQVDFKKTFEEYASGFGDPYGELWIGNRVLHAMTGDRPFHLRVEAKNLEGESRTGIWNTFSVGSEDTEFTLSIADYSSMSTLGDALWKPSDSSHSANNMKFSTFDRDNDQWSFSCAALYGMGGGWWYKSCWGVNPTAPFGDRNRNYNVAYWGYWENSVTFSQIAISDLQFLIRP